MDSIERLSEKKNFFLPDRTCFYLSRKDKATGEIGKKLDGHISYEEYLVCKKV